MIAFLTLIYVALLFVLMRMKVVPNTAMTWLSTLVWMAVLFIFLFIPMQWGAPQGPVRMMTRAVQIVPNVSGQVLEIAVKPNVPVKRGDLLFRIDPTPFQIAVDLAEASLVRAKAQSQQDGEALETAQAQLRQATSQRDLAVARYDDDAKLVKSGTITENRLEQRQTNLDVAIGAVDQARTAVSRAETELGAVTASGVVAKIAEAQANLDQARWNLEQTEVHAPGDGFVTNLALSVGQRVVHLPFAPSMVFIDTSERLAVGQIHQIYLRHVEPGQPVEIAFKTQPGRVIMGTVDSVLGIASQGQAIVSGTAAASVAVQAEPFLVRIKLNDPADLALLDAGMVGTAAIYTQSAGSTHVIRKVMIRMEAIMNYLNPAL